MEIELHQGDCLEVIKTLEDKCIDLTITSPPYNLGNNHHTQNNRHFPYHDDIPEEEYQTQQKDLLQEIYRITKDTGSLIYNHKNRIKKGTQITPYEWLLDTDWVIKQEWVWQNGSPNFDKIRLYPHTERIYWLAKDTKTKLQNTISHIDVFTSSEWKAVGVKGQKHARAFPEQLVDDVLSVFPEAEVIFDPYLGSGTTGVVCKRKGRQRFIGIELEPKYYDLAKERIEAPFQESLLEGGSRG